MKTKEAVRIRLSTNPKDVERIIRIETAADDFPLLREELLHMLQSRNVAVQIAEVREGGMDRIVGFATYELYPRKIGVTQIAVDPRYQRRGIGTQLLESLKRRLQPFKRHTLTCVVRESNTAGQLFLRANGILAERVLRKQFPKVFLNNTNFDEDGYFFALRLAEESEDGEDCQGRGKDGEGELALV